MSTEIRRFLVAAYGILSCICIAESIGSEGAKEDVKRQEVERIVGGLQAYEGQFPWAVALYFQGEFVCTGSLLNPTTVLTAAHCVVVNNQQLSAGDFYGVVGSVNRSSTSATRIGFASIAVYPDYEPQTLANDIAIMKTVSEVPFSNNIQAVCIPTANTPPTRYLHATAIGWGQDSRFSNDLPDILHYAVQKIALPLTCSARYPGVDSEKQLCGDGFGSGICKGDSGGPFTHIDRTGPPVEVGVASFIRNIPGCGSFIVSPGVYTRVSAYNAWIKREAGGTVCER